ncbi:uncharacterized protein BT62DRAFT_564608 [Guyanagaster necrorhizus]|uniref:Uncharacterized protein n=1 Tax=Guyanagaster necrorhizus TaxID=856835 RepID=A0A9P8AMF8_9AGAR|nr:uncharacterized protein BT62DRAFT_564608 [Guyanagaster necrorhizus MCA 3950]KAG7440855.1 hypothetical protein BT62DRAFT_564608 [Guyanagaster necrorhizus MCA 3950]
MSGTVTGPENQENTSATGSPSDSASSLRAAALLTLKSKRRKAAGEQSATAALPARPPPITDSFQLDYGQEDVVSSAASAPTPGSSKPHPVDMEDGQIREEGEISDSEEQLATAAPLTKPSPLPLKAAQSQPPQLEPAHEIKPSLASPSRMAIAKQESPPILLESITDISSSPLEIGDSPNMAVDVDESYSNNVYLAVGPDHVRPGLQMNQIQYDTAKDVILDLLGWGIPPTYLVDCGLSREIVYYVFNEFNLRLPDNFDTAGLIPYLPPPFYHSDAAQEASSSMPPPPVPSVLHYHNLPPRPLKLSDVQSPSPSSALPSSLATSSPSVSEPSPLTSLHDMERQRRQELLARKAVQASRKAKLPPPPSPNSSIASSRYVSPEHPPQDMDMATETVDDFLKTLEPTAEGEAMDVDEIPGLGRSHPVSQSPSISHQQSFMVGRVVLPLSSLPSMNAEQSSSSNSSTPTPTPLQKSASMISLDGQPVRRRPVAADFVDMDGSSRNGNGLANGRSHPPHNLRRKMGTGFANVSKMRRLVIDLSDSEGEGDEDYVMHEAGEYSSSTSSYPTTIFGTKASRGPRTQSPATLMEKEMEIARMRQLIADKEQNRVKKLMRTSSMQEPANGVSEKPVPVKQEEVDPNLDIPINGSAGERIPTTNLPRIQVAAATAAIASTSAMPLHGSLLSWLFAPRTMADCASFLFAFPFSLYP